MRGGAPCPSLYMNLIGLHHISHSHAPLRRLQTAQTQCGQGYHRTEHGCLVDSHADYTIHTPYTPAPVSAAAATSPRDTHIRSDEQPLLSME